MPGPGLLSTILDTTGTRIKERLDSQKTIDEDLRKTQTEKLLASIYAVDENGNPKMNEMDIEDAWNRIEGLHKGNKSIKDILMKARDVTGKIFQFGLGKNGSVVDKTKANTQQQINQTQPSPAPANAAFDRFTSPPVAAVDDNVSETYSGLPQPPQRTSAQPQAPRSMASMIQAGAPNPVKVKIAEENRATDRTIASEGRANTEADRRTSIAHSNALEIEKLRIQGKVETGDEMEDSVTDEVKGERILIFRRPNNTTYEVRVPMSPKPQDLTAGEQQDADILAAYAESIGKLAKDLTPAEKVTARQLAEKKTVEDRARANVSIYGPQQYQTLNPDTGKVEYTPRVSSSGSMAPGGNVSAVTQDMLSGYMTEVRQMDNIMPQLKKQAASLGPLAGRVTMAEVGSLSGLGATKEQIALATDLQRALMSAAFANGGKQLTTTEKAIFETLLPSLKDTFQQAVIKAERARQYLLDRGKDRMGTMPVNEFSKMPPAVREFFGVGTPASNTGGARGGSGLPDPPARSTTGSQWKVIR